MMSEMNLMRRHPSLFAFPSRFAYVILVKVKFKKLGYQNNCQYVMAEL